ncbi:MAG: hypothetical protein K6G50_06610, partial [bacterium]|nr:hypothetical protein [bacterium]
GKNKFDLMLYDSKTDKTQTIASSIDTPYKYVFLSANGKAMIACKMDEKAGRLSIFTANEDNNWELKGVKGMGNSISIGYIRISYDGKHMLLQNESGLRVADL